MHSLCIDWCYYHSFCYIRFSELVFDRHGMLKAFLSASTAFWSYSFSGWLHRDPFYQEEGALLPFILMDV